MTLIDAVGREHPPIDLAQAPPRIVSLVPSLTELLCDLGLAHWLVGRTGFCIHPAGIVPSIPKVGGTKDVNIDKVRALAPTHLIVNIDENEKSAVDLLAQSIPHVIVTHPLAPHDNLALYRLLGGVFGAQQRAESLCLAFEREWAVLDTLPQRAPKTVLYCIWKDPWMTVGADTYIARMLEQIGWRQYTVVDPALRYPQFAWSEQVLRDIDAILLSTEPYRFTAAHASALEKQLGKPVLLLDGEMMSWYGSRAIHGMRYLRQLAQSSMQSLI